MFVPTPKHDTSLDTTSAHPFVTPAAARTRLPLLLGNNVLVSMNDPVIAAKIVSSLIETYPNAERDEPKGKKQKI